MGGTYTCKTTVDRLGKAVSSITVFVAKTLPSALKRDLVLQSFFSCEENLQMIGEIILVYSQTHVAHRNVKVIIKHCDISNINSSTKIEQKGENSVISADLLSHAIGLIIHQLLYIETQIHNLVVTNITTVNGPLLLVSIHSTELCALNLKLNNSTFSNNKNKLYPVVNYLLNTSHSSKQLPAIFTISNSKFCRNHNATHIFKMSNIANESATLALEGRNEFLENSVTSSLLSVTGAIPVIVNCTTIENNTANIIFTFSKYIELYKSARVEIIGNKYNSTQKSFNRFIFEKTSQISTRCPFQLVKFCNNIGYYRELYGKYLKYNCSWIESLQKEYQDQFEFKSPEYTYRRTVFNCDKEAGLFKWENDLFSCNQFYTFGKASLDVTHSPAYPGQSITLTLLHLHKSIRMYPDFANINSNSVFTDILPTCQLDFSKHTIDIVYKRCTNLSYTIKSNSTKISSCLLNLQTATPKNTLYTFRVNISHCPIGFSLDTSNGICTCDPKVEEQLKGIECRLSDKLPPLSWMSRINNEIIFTRFCNFDYCLIPEIFILLDNPDDHCLSGRGGIACGRCAEGLGTVFGTSRCKRCSNVGLFIIPVLAVVGVTQ